MPTTWLNAPSPLTHTKAPHPLTAPPPPAAAFREALHGPSELPALRGSHLVDIDDEVLGAVELLHQLVLLVGVQHVLKDKQGASEWMRFCFRFLLPT